MLLINVHSQHPKHHQQYQQHPNHRQKHQSQYIISPSRERYWDLQAKILTEKAVGIDKDKIHEAISQVRLEDEAYHERIIEYLTH